MVRPVRFSSISLQPQRSVLNTLPLPGTSQQIIKYENFIPYNAANYTITQTNGAVAAAALNSGAVLISTTGTTTSDAAYISTPVANQQVVPGNQLWFDAKIVNRQVSTDYTLYCGLFDNVNPASASNGIYFVKPSGGTTVNFVIKKAGTTTTFTTIADLARPSGLPALADPNGSAGVLTTAGSGGNYTSVVVATPGAGYAAAPLVLATGATGANGALYCQIGSTAYGIQSYAQASLPSSTGIPYGSLAMPYITNIGNAAYTTYTNEIDPVIDLQFYFDAKGRLIVGVWGRQVMAIGGSAVEVAPTAMVPGTTYNIFNSSSGLGLTTGADFSTIGTQLTSAIAPFQPALGSFYNVAPQVPLLFSTGILNTTANARSVYLYEYTVGGELN